MTTKLSIQDRIEYLSEYHYYPEYFEDFNGLRISREAARILTLLSPKNLTELLHSLSVHNQRSSPSDDNKQG